MRINELALPLAESRPRAGPPLEEEKPAGGDEGWLQGVLRRHRPAVEDATERGDYQATYFQPLDEPRVRWVYVDGPVKFYNEQGRRFERGNNLYASDRLVARLGNQLLLTAEPELGFVEERQSGDASDITARFQELAACVRLGPAEVTAGRTPLWWGPGRHGSLLLSNNARPFDLLRVGTAVPQFLPGLLSYLGGVQAQVFATHLEDDLRPIHDPYLAGARVETRLNPYLELGASRTAEFGGSGHPVTPRTVGHVITADTENNPGDPGNQLASVDARLIIPWHVQPFEVYGELGGEDESGGFFSKMGFLLGIYLPRLGSWRLFELSVEVADTTVSGRPRTWYAHGSYPYTFRGDIIGHHVGTDGLDIFSELRIHPGERWVVFLSHDHEEHFRLDPVVELLEQFRVGLEARAWRGLWASGFYGLDWWRNFAARRGDTEIGHALGLGLRWEF